MDRSLYVMIFTPLLLVSSYLFYNAEPTGSEARPELVAALFAHVPKEKQFVRTAFEDAVPSCLSKHTEGKNHPFIERLLVESWGSVVDIESARKGEVPSQIEFNAHFANAMLKFTMKNEVYLAGIKGEELSTFEADAKRFEADGLEIAKCIIITAGEKVPRPAT